MTIRYDPRDVWRKFASSIRTASSAGPSPPKLREKLLRSATSFVFATAVVENSRSILDSRQKTVDALLHLKKGQSIERTRVQLRPPAESTTKIKRYRNE